MDGGSARKRGRRFHVCGSAFQAVLFIICNVSFGLTLSLSKGEAVALRQSKSSILRQAQDEDFECWRSPLHSSLQPDAHPSCQILDELPRHAPRAAATRG